MKVRTLLITILMCFIIISPIIYTAYINTAADHNAKNQYKNYIDEITYEQGKTISLYFNSLTRIAESVTDSPYIVQFTEKCNIDRAAFPEKMEHKPAADFLKSYVGINSQISHIDISNKQNTKVILSTDSTLLNTPPLKRNAQYMNIHTPIVVQKDNDYEIALQTAINDCDITLFFKNKELKHIFEMTSFPKSGKLLLIDPTGLLIDEKYVDVLATTNTSEYIDLKTQFEAKAPTAEVSPFYIHRTEKYASYKFLPEVRWIVAITALSEHAVNESAVVGANLIGTVIILIICFAGLSLIFVSYITRPLYIIEDILKKISKGDNAARIDLKNNQVDEYNKIKNSFNELVDDIIVSEVRYRTIVEMSDNIIFEWNLLTNEVSFSNNYNRMFSYRPPTDMFKDSFLMKCKVRPEDSVRYHADIDGLAEGRTFDHREYRFKNVYGDYIWMLVRTDGIHDDSGKIVKIVGVFVDIDREKKSEMLLTTRASYDSLTQLYNRETIETAINAEIDLISARNSQFAILFIDIDDFKTYNDKYSHATGDQVLKFTADAIRQTVSAFGLAGRYGGDEFVICVRNADINNPSDVATKILEVLNEGFICDIGEKLSVRVSIGIAIIKDNTKRVDEIIGQADDAMYKIKKNGKSNFGYLE